MVKSPLEYFEAQDFAPAAPAGKGAFAGAVVALEGEPGTGGKAFSDTEQAFMLKYLGINSGVHQGTDLTVSAVVPVQMETAATAAPPENALQCEKTHSVADTMLQESSEESLLQQLETVQLVGFYVGEQLYTIATAMVQEVIHQMPSCKLPTSSPYVNGVINLRGHVTPLIKLRDMLGAGLPLVGDCDRFTIVCRGKGVQIGVQIDRVHSMYRIEQREIQWNLDASLGLAGECVTGLFELDEKLVPIISIERVVGQLLSSHE